MSVLLKKHYNGHCKATDKECNQGGPEREICRQKCDRKFQVQVKEDRDGSKRWSWIDTTTPLKVST